MVYCISLLRDVSDAECCQRLKLEQTGSQTNSALANSVIKFSMIFFELFCCFDIKPNQVIFTTTYYLYKGWKFYPSSSLFFFHSILSVNLHTSWLFGFLMRLDVSVNVCGIDDYDSLVSGHFYTIILTGLLFNFPDMMRNTLYSLN